MAVFSSSCRGAVLELEVQADDGPTLQMKAGPESCGDMLLNCRGTNPCVPWSMGSAHQREPGACGSSRIQELGAVLV